MASTPDLRRALPLAKDLHPSVPLLATADAAGHLRVLDLASGAILAAADVPLGPSRDQTLALGGPPERALIAWITPDGSPALWAWGDPHGLAGSPSILSDLKDFLPEIPGAGFSKVWLTGGPRAWLVLAGHPSGGLVTNGRVSAFLDPPDRIIAAAASPSASMLAVLTQAGDLIFIHDPETAPSQTDPLGPALLAVPERLAACPLSTLWPTRLSLPIGARPANIRNIKGFFPPSAVIRWCGEDRLTVSYAGPVASPRADLPPQMERRWLLIEAEEGPMVLMDQALPDWVDFGVRMVLDGDGMPLWLSPQPNGGMLVRPDDQSRSRFVSCEDLAGSDFGMAGYPGLFAELRAHGLRWDGQEIQLDRFRPDVFEVFDRALSTGQGTGPVEPTILIEDAHQRLVGDVAAADRLLLFRPLDAEAPRVLFHPVLARIPDAMRWRREGRPSVRLLALDIEPAGDYLALWRAPGGVELWSLRAADRLKAWAWDGAPEAEARRVVLAVDDPAYLPALHILEDLGVGPAGRLVSVATVDFGDRAVAGVGTLRLPEAAGIEDLVPLDLEGRRWQCHGGALDARSPRE